MDNEPFLWKTINFFYKISSSKQSDHNHPWHWPTVEKLQNVLDVHRIRSPLPKFHHIRILILDKQTNLPFLSVIDIIYANECLRKHLKMLSMKECGIPLKQIHEGISMLEGCVRTDWIERMGWRIKNTGEVAWQVRDKSGATVSRETQMKERGVGMEFIAVRIYR